jgi:UDP:flavonoid glycosyltransferase YjiC (YdhE family)
VLLTTGESGDPEEIRSPANAHVEVWWPQQAVMPHAAAVIGHGGMGTTMAGLAAGVPMVVLPIFADQPFNARRVHALGAGILVDGGPAGVGAIPAALTEVLGVPSYRQQAGAVRDAVRALPEVAEAVPFLEQVAAG